MKVHPIGLFLALGVLACSSPQTPPDEAAPPPVSAATVPQKRNAIVVVLDTLRADAARAAKTPTLDAIAARGDQVEHAWSAGTWTVPSVISLLTGMPVRQHGWDQPSGRIGQYPTFPSVPTLAETLHAEDFRTVGFFANTYLSEELGFQRGFDAWRRTPDAAMAKRVRQEVATWTDDGRYFLYIHLLGPHSPLDPSAEARARWNVEDTWFEGRGGLSIGRAKRNREEGVREAYKRAYHAAIEDTDAVLAEILAAIGPHRDDAVLVVTSDHGELLGEHGTFGHGHWLWQPLTQVPLIVEGGGSLPDHLGIAAVPDIVTTSVGVSHRWPVQRTDALPLVAQREGKLAISPDGRWKGIWDEEAHAFDLQADPAEESPREVSQALSKAKSAFEDRFPAGSASGEAIDLHPDTIESLRVLGYIDEEAEESK